MKLKTKTLILGLLLMSPNLFAQSDGTRGGGHVIEVNGSLELVDLVTKATCEWLSGNEMIAKVPYIESVLEKIEKLDWYLAFELKREIQYLSWCMTGELYSVKAYDDESFVRQLTKGVQQAAFRYNESAYIDMEKFDHLSESSQAYLIIHEVTHSYLDMDLPMRQLNLMSIVKTFQRVDKGQIKTQEELHKNLLKNNMAISFEVKRLTPAKESILFALDGLDNRVAKFLSVLKPEELIKQNLYDLEKYLNAHDRLTLRTPEMILTEVVKEILVRQNSEELDILFNKQKFRKINPMSIALSKFDELSLEVQEFIMDSANFNQVLEDGTTYLNEIKISLNKEGRLIGDHHLQSLTKQSSLSNVVHLTSLEEGATNLPTPVEAMSQMIVILAKEEYYDVIETAFNQNNDFLVAMYLYYAEKQLESLEPVIKREKPLAQQILKAIQKKLISDFLTNIQMRLDKEQYTEVLKRLSNLQ